MVDSRQIFFKRSGAVVLKMLTHKMILKSIDVHSTHAAVHGGLPTRRKAARIRCAMSAASRRASIGDGPLRRGITTGELGGRRTVISGRAFGGRRLCRRRPPLATSFARPTLQHVLLHSSTETTQEASKSDFA